MIRAIETWLFPAPRARRQRNKPEIASFETPARAMRTLCRDRVIRPASPRIMHLAPDVTNDPVQMPDLPGGIAQLTLRQPRQKS
ncbi:hypothetical protein BCO37747_01408 [Burkholderia contaminans]|uniref:Uncharacterized protein n=1 Tax=Burkholderia contaminans TaxID=488447 RepID=A0A250L363_9BURK|nr:hypothetical protein SK875_B00976 [Burkholderia contaminans]BBA39033.1 hypothetical protein BCCH1_14540 [Burkholderia contaminans]GLZ67402.1 hypothetical protein Bcon01_04470 [Burkholderia contaminans]VWB66975.1 hypothetical protein BCO23253_03164 [Burkholderia contaminans]VWC84018.1 hypothetical protein BCO37747_01408 [Burkholderia contaminans]